jgi:hypothetical protein
VSDGGNPEAASSALVLRGDKGISPQDEVLLQKLWLGLQARPWQSLAVLAASRGVPTLEAANSLARIGWWYTGRPSCVLDMRDLSLRLLEHQIRSMGAQLQGGERVFVALRSLSENPTASPLAMAADAAVLCVQLGKTDIKSAKQTIAAIGKNRFIGSILVSETGAPIAQPQPPAPGQGKP